MCTHIFIYVCNRYIRSSISHYVTISLIAIIFQSLYHPSWHNTFSASKRWDREVKGCPSVFPVMSVHSQDKGTTNDQGPDNEGSD